MNSDTLIIDRSLSLKDQSPFIIIQDSFAQSSRFLVDEIIYKSASVISHKIYLSFETFSKPPFINEEKDLFVDCLGLDGDTDQGLAKILIPIKEFMRKIIPNSQLSHFNESPKITTNASIVETLANSTSSDSKILIIIDTLNYLEGHQISKFAADLMRIHPNFVILSTLHSSIPESGSSNPYYPSKSNLLTYIATTIFDISFHHPNNSNGDASDFDDEYLHDQYYKKFMVPQGLNRPQSNQIKLSKFKKSGKKIELQFLLDSQTHEFSLYDPDAALQARESAVVVEGDESLLKDLSTFNLSTSDKQKQARNQVELPYLDAQKFQDGGAIVYQFEKDDDYDEEDPYEDPF
ncbi:Elongator subunit [Saccharomycopsis crataegensis]|uniref:Elongator complex protein 5 n=1 Tax=Saccharomycopsis crataegensis TaxID=43959 RepID=A0AAV5QFA7_9ASCO|nr:Elongator subunit [Saccharomycopsis crataegensis]